MHQRQHRCRRFPEQVELGGHAEHFVGVLLGPIAKGIGDQGHGDSRLAGLAAQREGVTRIAAGFEHHQHTVLGGAEQHFGVMPGGTVDPVHVIAQVLQQMHHGRSDAAFGLEPGDEHLAPSGQALADGVPGRGEAVFVDLDQCRDFQFEAAG
ncbi:hypothetical protein D3C84_495220 [compost metagenome]